MRGCATDAHTRSATSSHAITDGQSTHKNHPIHSYNFNYSNYNLKIKPMKKLKTSLLVISALISISILHAQTVDDIINKHIDALGGKDKLSQVTSLYVESTVNAMGNDNSA